jgi:hypothetical protein
MPPQGVPTREEAPEIYGNIPGNIVNEGIPSLTVAGTDFEATTETTTEYKELDGLVPPWTQDDVYAAWHMVDMIANDLPPCFNYAFADYDKNGEAELVLTNEYFSGISIYVFKKSISGITQIPFERLYDFESGRAVICIPKTDIKSFGNITLSILENEMDKLIIGKDLDGNCYLSGMSAVNGFTGWIRQLIYLKGEVKAKEIYQWGYFLDNQGNEDWEPIEIFMYKKYLYDDEAIAINAELIRYDSTGEPYIEILQNEIDDFLFHIYGDKYKELYP